MEIGKRSKALSADVLGQLESNIAQFFGEINDTTKKHFQELLARSIEDSLSLEDTKEAITRLFNGYIEGVDNIKVLEEMGVYSPRIVVDNGNAVVTPTSRYNQMYNSIMLSDNKEEGLKALYGIIDPLDSEGAGVLQKIRDQIEVSNITFARSETIARTEVGRIAGFIQRKTYFSSEFVKRLEWLSAHDKFTRTEPEGGHLAADGQTREKGIKFSVGGEWLEYPGDPEGSAENTINCRCTLLPILE